MASKNRMKLTILGGFLGAGKSTWLRHQIFDGKLQNAYVVINEFADAPVDDTMLQQASGLYMLCGTCACCAGRAELVRILREICGHRSRRTRKAVNHLILETTGVADPAGVIAAIETDPVLARHIVLGETVVLADGRFGLDQLRREALARKQAEIADRILVSKIDQSDAGLLADLVATLRALNPHARFCASDFGVETPLRCARSGTPQSLPQANSVPITSGVLRPSQNRANQIDWAGFSVWLSAILYKHGASLVRVKGVVRTPAGRLLLQSVQHHMQAPEILPEDGAPHDPGAEINTIALIGRGIDTDAMATSLRKYLRI